MGRTLSLRCSVSCSAFEHISSFLEWTQHQKAGFKAVIHLLDDFLFVSPVGCGQCFKLLRGFVELAGEQDVPLAHEKNNPHPEFDIFRDWNGYS